MNFKKQIFGFMDMLRFKKLVPNRREALASGANTPLPKEYRTNQLAQRLHPGMMDVELVNKRKVSSGMVELTFKRLDSNAFPFFRAGQYVSLQGKVGASVVSRPYSIVSSPRQALENKLILGVENAGFFSGYLNDEAAVGTRFRMSEPSGEFHYETLRDTKKIVCLAGGAGITPFLSMAQSLIQGDEDYEMTLFYGARDTKHLAFKEELDKMTHKNLKVIYVLSDEEKEGYEKGFISAKLIEKYVNIKESTFFLCGPQPMYDFLEKEFAPYSLPVKAFHRDGTCCPSLKLDEPKTFQLTIHIRDQKYVVEAKENETILVAMERGGIPAPNKCRAGGCGYCHSKWYKGEFSVAEGRDGRREADKKFGFIHPCVSYPLSDLEIEVPCEE